MKEKGQNYWADSTGTPQGQGREGVLCYPFSIQISVTPFSSSFLQSTCRCYSGEAAQESEFVPSWEKQMWMWEVKALCRTLVGLEKGRHQIAPTLGWKQSRQRKGAFPSFTPSHHPKATSLNQTQLEVLPMILCCFSYQLLLHHFFLTFSFLIQSLA